MKKGELIKINEILNKVIISDLSIKGQKAILKNLYAIKPIFENYSGIAKLAEDKCKPEGYDEAIQKAEVHNKAVEENKEEGRLSQLEFTKINLLLFKYKQLLEEYFEELNNEESGIDLLKIDEDDYFKIVASAKDVPAGDLSVLLEIVE